jgi:hypothetical protein
MIPFDGNEWRRSGGVCYNVQLLKCSFTAG